MNPKSVSAADYLASLTPEHSGAGVIWYDPSGAIVACRAGAETWESEDYMTARNLFIEEINRMTGISMLDWIKRRLP